MSAHGLSTRAAGRAAIHEAESPADRGAAERLQALDWQRISQDLDEHGNAIIGSVLVASLAILFIRKRSRKPPPTAIESP